MKLGDRISTFMDRIGKGAVNGRVCIVLSDKYLKSPYCMHELFDVWRNCREDDDTLSSGRGCWCCQARKSQGLPSGRNTSFTGSARSRRWIPLSRAIVNSCCRTSTMPSSG